MKINVTWFGTHSIPQLHKKNAYTFFLLLIAHHPHQINFSHNMKSPFQIIEILSRSF